MQFSLFLCVSSSHRLAHFQISGFLFVHPLYVTPHSLSEPPLNRQIRQPEIQGVNTNFQFISVLPCVGLFIYNYLHIRIYHWLKQYSSLCNNSVLIYAHKETRLPLPMYVIQIPYRLK